MEVDISGERYRTIQQITNHEKAKLVPVSEQTCRREMDIGDRLFQHLMKRTKSSKRATWVEWTERWKLWLASYLITFSLWEISTSDYWFFGISLYTARSIDQNNLICCKIKIKERMRRLTDFDIISRRSDRIRQEINQLEIKWRWTSLEKVTALSCKF